MNRILIIILAVASSIINCWSQKEIPARLTDRPEQIIKHCGYTLSYNKERGTPNWSAWMLTRSYVNSSTSVSRSDLFLPDPFLLKSRDPEVRRSAVSPSDYTNSGYDRGHMCPAADMAYSKKAMHDCFYMSNMCPQTPTLNRISWKALESKCREWIMSEDTLYIVAGPIYKGVPQKIGGTHKVDIPTGFYKVILSLRKGKAKAIGFYYSNTSTKQPITTTAKTVDEIEKLTGLDFFYTLDDSLEEQLESRYNLNDWR